MDVERKQRDIATWALDPDFRFDDIYNFITNEDWLRRAFLSVKANAGSGTAGIDGETAADFANSLDENIRELSQQLDSETYDPDPTRRVYIPKGNGEKRPLSVPTVRDRIVQESLRMLIEPIYEADFSPYSFGFRPGRSTHDAIHVVQECLGRAAGGYKPWIIDADIEGFFDNLDHVVLEQILQDRITQQKVRDLIWKFLKGGVMEGKRLKETIVGTPQGGILSPLLANVYLNELDQAVKSFTDLTENETDQRRNAGKGNWTYVRYADDFLLLSNGRKREVEEMEERLREYLDAELALTLSERKTEIVHVNDGFDFLGFHVERTVNRKGEKQTQITIPKEATDNFREKIYIATSGNYDSSERTKIVALNAVIRGWGEYYKYCWGAASEYNALDHFIWWRLVKWMARKHQSSVSKVLKRIGKKKARLTVAETSLQKRQDIDTSGRHVEKFFKDHPYLKNRPVRREKLPRGKKRLGNKEGVRAGFADQRFNALKRDDWSCQECGTNLTRKRAEVHHKKPARKYDNPEEANRLDNLVSLCAECHEKIDSARKL